MLLKRCELLQLYKTLKDNDTNEKVFNQDEISALTKSMESFKSFIFDSSDFIYFQF